MSHGDHHAALRGGGQGVEGPEQGAGLKHQHPVGALPAHPFPESTSQVVEPFPFSGGLALEPALQLGIIGAAAQHVALVGGQFGRGGQLGGPPLLQPLPPLAFPTQVAGLPEHLPLQRVG